MKSLELDSLGLPTKDDTATLINLLVKNITEIEDTTGESHRLLPSAGVPSAREGEQGEERRTPS